MSEIAFLDVSVRAAAIGYIMLICIRTLLAGPAGAIGLRLRLAFAWVCVCGFLGVNTSVLQTGPPSSVAGVAALLSGFAAVGLWLLVRALFRGEGRLTPLEYVVLSVWTIILLGTAGQLPLVSQSSAEFGQLMLAIALAIHGVAIILGERDGDLIESRKRLRRPLGAIAATFLLVDGLVDLVFGQHFGPAEFVILQNSAILTVGAWFVIALEPSRVARLAATPQPMEGTLCAPDPLEARLARRIAGLIEEEQIHLKTELSFADFVSATGERETDVRRYINHRLGFGHFRQFLNHHRVATARGLLAAPQTTPLKIASVAFDSGFSSLASFNRAFRAVEGCSPREFKAQAAAGGAAKIG